MSSHRLSREYNRLFTDDVVNVRMFKRVEVGGLFWKVNKEFNITNYNFSVILQLSEIYFLVKQKDMLRSKG